ncbi:MAG: hypothetical protein ABUL49_00930, partial [bacterium]
MFRPQLASLVRSAVESLVASQRLPSTALEVAVEIDTPRQAAHGDFMTNFAMVSAKAIGKPPRETAEALAEVLRASEHLSSVEVAGPGFVNLSLSPTFMASVLGQILAAGESFASAPVGTGEKINVEFVYVNPNGPITIGSGRGAAYGSALCNVLEAAGNTIHREYYINDGVNSEQMRLFAESVRYYLQKGAEGDISLQAVFPQGGYKGDYVEKVAVSLYIDGMASIKAGEIASIEEWDITGSEKSIDD